jgi:hypothetical protein
MAERHDTAALKGARPAPTPLVRRCSRRYTSVQVTELMQFVDWVSNRARSWSTVRKQMPTMADLFTAACDEYNWKWKTSVTPMLLLRWVTMDWGGDFRK